MTGLTAMNQQRLHRADGILFAVGVPVAGGGPR